MAKQFTATCKEMLTIPSEDGGDISNNICPNNCSNNGKCVKGELSWN